jgi:hypothetical protein
MLGKSAPLSVLAGVGEPLLLLVRQGAQRCRVFRLFALPLQPLLQ